MDWRPEELRNGINNLRRAFDAFNLPFNKESGIASRFTRLLTHCQIDSELEGRWIKIIDEQKDNVLFSSPETAIRGLLALPKTLNFKTIENSLDRLMKFLQSQMEDVGKKRIHAAKLKRSSSLGLAHGMTRNSIWHSHDYGIIMNGYLLHIR